MISALTDNGISVYCQCLKRSEETQNNEPKPHNTMIRSMSGLNF